MKSPEKELDAGVFLLKCYYFKGKFVSQNDDEKKDKIQNKPIKKAEAKKIPIKKAKSKPSVKKTKKVSKK